MQTLVEPVTREEVVELAKTMSLEKLAVWYEYGLFVQSRPLIIPDTLPVQDDNDDLMQELAAWEAASDEDWLKMERTIGDLD